jgi:hypothetical protein
MENLLAWSLTRARRQTLDLCLDLGGGREEADPGEHHPVWIVGHLVLADSYLLYLLGAAALPEDFGALIERHGPASRPDSADGRLDALASRLGELGDRRIAAIEALGVEGLERPMPDPVLASVQPKLAHHLHAQVCHEGYHAGQLAAWRRRHGRPPARWAFAPER